MKKILLLFLLISSIVFADLKGSGEGKNELEAKNNALSDLSSRVQVEVSSEYSSKSNDSNKGYKFEDVSMINLKTSNDFLGVDISVKKNSMFKDEYKAVATLKSDKLHLYYNKIIKLDENMLVNFKLTNDGSKREKLNYLEKVSKDYEQREKYSYIVVALGGEVSKPSVSQYKIERKKKYLQKEIQQTVTMALNVIGDIDENTLLFFQKELSSSVADKRVVLKYIEDGTENYYVDINVIEVKKETIPENFVMPEMTSIRINTLMEVINSDGEVIFSKNMIGEAEEIEKKQSMDAAMKIVKLSFNENLKILLEE